MTRVYFVRHAQPEHDWKEDRTRPLTEESKKDSAIVLEFLKAISWLANRNIAMWRGNLRASSVRIRSSEE